MKNRRLLLISVFLLSQTLNAKDGLTPIDELEPGQLFSIAQAAYEKNDCKTTNRLLTKYLTKAKPSNLERKRILNVIGWCSLYLDEGTTYHLVRGCCDPGAGSEEWFEENDFGKTMHGYKEPLR